MLALLPLAIPASPAQAACSAVFTAATDVIFLCGNADEAIRFDVAGSILRHNRATAGDGGFDDEDFNSFAAGKQMLGNSPFNRVTVIAGTGDQHVVLGSAAGPAGSIQARFILDATNTGTDRLTVDDSGNASAQQPIELTDTGVTLGTLSATYSGAISLFIRTFDVCELAEVKTRQLVQRDVHAMPLRPHLRGPPFLRFTAAFMNSDHDGGPA